MIKYFSKIEGSNTVLTLFGLSFVLFGWFVFLLTLGNIFFFPFIAFGASLTFTFSFLIGIKLFIRSATDFKVAILIALFSAILIGFFTVPTLFSGRDQGSISEAAFRLAENGKLLFSTQASDAFFHIYGEGTALNFPGFAYTKTGELITQFPLGYTSWLASFVSLCGLYGFVIGNCLLFFLFLLTLYALLRIFVHPFYAFSGLALTLFSFLPTWFAKITLSENLALFLFVFLIYNLILFLQENKTLSYAGILLSGGLLAFTRIEGFAFLALACILLFVNKPARFIWKIYPWQSIIFPSILFVVFFLRDFFINLPYYKMIGKALLKFLHQLGKGDIIGDLATAGNSFSLWSIFFLYGLLVLFILGLVGIILFIKERRFLVLLPTIIALPTFVYLLDPNISLDHPWMLRRFLFSLFPTLLFSAVIGSAFLFSKEKIFPISMPRGKQFFSVIALFFGLMLLQYPAFLYGLPFAENRGLENQIATISKEFSNLDLILVDKNVTGDGFAMLTGPGEYLFGKNMVYFFNPNDLASLEKTSFLHIYLLVPESDQMRYISVFGNHLMFKKTITISNEQFEKNSLENNAGILPSFPKKIMKETFNSLFQVY